MQNQEAKNVAPTKVLLVKPTGLLGKKVSEKV